MSQLGRISGPLLKANLLRQGVDLAFETDLLYLDVNNRRIGIKTASPTHDLQVVGTTRTTNLEVTGTTAQLGNFTITNGVINYDGGDITFNLPEGSALRTNKFTIDSIDIFDNIIRTNTSNADLELRPSGTGSVVIRSDAQIAGDVSIAGNITANGNIVLGDTATDTVTLNAKIAGDLIPSGSNFYTLGADPSTGGNRWDNVWAQNLYADTLTTENLVIDGVNISALPGNILYVSAENGNDTFGGEHPNDPFRTIGYALSQATAGTTVYLYPGTYQEDFPLTVPVGVTVKGTGIRAVKVTPTTATRYNDAFLLNGETTVEDLTVADFFSGGNLFEVTAASSGSLTVNVGTAPFAHTYVSGGTLTGAGIASANITGATYDHTTGELIISHTGTTATIGPDVFISGLIFSCNGGNRTFPDNGYAFRFAADFEVTTRSPYVRNISVITKGSVVSGSDPLGFDSGDAGKGAYVDGAYANASSREAAMLFHSVTFITPGVDGLTATNGARVEWLNSFTYYANKGMNLVSSLDGFAGDGKTRVKISDKTGVWAPADTITYYDVDGTTVLASGTVESVDGDFIVVDGKSDGWETPSDRVGKTVTVYGDAQLSTAQKKFGTASLLLDGTGDYLGVSTQPDFGFGTGDFTVETWVRLTDLVGTQQVIDFRAGAVGDIAPVIYVSNGGQLRYYTNSADRIIGSTLASGTDYHIALSRESGNTKLFVNGTQVGSTYVDANDYGTTKPLTVGARYDGGNETGGYFDELRVTKGLARYTSNFTAPTAAFLGDTSTVLLLHFNGSNGSTVIVDDGVTYQDIRSSSGGIATVIDYVDYSDFGAEVRSIASASVYGNYGVVGDGDGVVAYLIGQNLAYIGNGKSTDNDPSTVIQANEVVETNRAKIFYTSVDHKGDFRVGDLFYINQDTGEVTFSNSDIEILGSILFTDGSNQTYIDATKIETGDFRISNNTIETLSQQMVLNSFTGDVNFANNLNITGDLDVAGNVTIGGNITIGDQTTDSVNFTARVDSDIIPNLNDTYDLGSTIARWKEIFVNKLTSDGIQIFDNVITTTDSNSDLELAAAGTGSVVIPNNDLIVTQSLTVQGTTDLADTTISGNLNLTGDLSITGNVSQNGNLTISGTVSAESLDLENIEIFQNVITTKNTNSDLELRAAGTGNVVITDSDLVVSQILVNGTLTGTNITNTGDISATRIQTEQLRLEGNTIFSDYSNADIELRTSGTGEIVFLGDVQASNGLEVIGTTTVAAVNQTGTLTLVGDLDHTGNITQTGDTTITGNFTVTGTTTVGSVVEINNNSITKTDAGDLTISAQPGNKVIIDQDAEVVGDLSVLGDVSILGNTNFVTVNAATAQFENIRISGNVIETTVTNSDLELRSVGAVLIDSNDLQITNGLTVDGTAILADTNITGAVGITGAVTHIGNYDQTGDLTVGGTVSVTGQATIDQISIDGNTVSSTGNLVLSSTGSITVPSNDVTVTQDLTVDGTLTAGTIDSPATQLEAGSIKTTDIEISGNLITTVSPATNIILDAAGSGIVQINSGTLEVLGDIDAQDITATDLTVTGTFNQTGNTIQTGVFDQTGTVSVTGLVDIQGRLNSDNVVIENNVITTETLDSDLQLSAAGTGLVLIPSNDVTISQDLTVLGNITVNTLTVSNSLVADVISNGDIEIENNVIRTTQSNSDLELVANGTGSILIPANNVEITENLTVSGNTNLQDTEIFGTLTHTGNVVQIGNVSQTGDLAVSGVITVSGTALFEDISIVGNTISTTLSNSDLELTAAGTGRVVIPNADLQVDQDVVVNGDLIAFSLNINGTITADRYTNGDILLDANTISTTQTNSNLELSANGTGSVVVNSDLIATQDLTVVGSTTLSDVDIVGGVSINGNITQTGNTTQTGDYTLDGNLITSGYAQFSDIRIENNQIATTVSSSDLEIIASGSGLISIPSNNVSISNDLTVGGTLTVTDLSLAILETGIVQTSDIKIQNNFITTTQSNSDLELRASGTGSVIIPNNDLIVNQDLTVDGTTNLSDTNITGTVTHIGDSNITGNVTQTGDYNLTGSLTVSGISEIADIQINGNQIISLNGYNLILDAAGGGNIYVPENDVLIENDLIVNGTLTVTNVQGVFESVVTTEIDTGDIIISGNRITTTQSNSDLELRTSGTGSVIIPDADLEITGDLAVTGTTDLNDTNINGSVVHIGNTTHTGDLNQTGNFDITGSINITGAGQFTDILINGNQLKTTVPGSDLQLQAAGSGKIYVPFNNVLINGNTTVNGNIATNDVTVSGTVSTPTLTVGSISINGNLITTTVSNSNLELRASGTGAIEIESVLINENQITTATDQNLTLAPNGTGIVDIQGTQAVRLPRGGTLDRPTGQTGMVRYNSDTNVYEGYNGTSWKRLDGVYDSDENTYITAETTPGANDNVINFYVDGVNKATLNATEFSTDTVNIGNINISGNTISTTNVNGDLVFSPNGTGRTVIGTFALKDNAIINTQTDAITYFNQTGTGYFKISGTNGYVIPVGSIAQRGALVETGMMRYNTTDSRVEVYDGTQWVSAAGSSSTGITYSEAEALAITTALIFG